MVRSVVVPLSVSALVFSLFVAAPAAAPERSSREALLKDVFEGRRVVVRIDMPATKDGVNVYPEERRDLDIGRYRNDLRRHGVALRAGESAIVTLVKVKDDLIEFQLNGGGYGTFFDQLSDEKEWRREVQRRYGGSRFNIRFDRRVPYGFGPDDIMDVLSRYVDFGGRWDRRYRR